MPGVGPLQGQPSIGRLGLVILATSLFALLQPAPDLLIFPSPGIESHNFRSSWLFPTDHLLSSIRPTTEGSTKL